MLHHILEAWGEKAGRRGVTSAGLPCSPQPKPTPRPLSIGPPTIPCPARCHSERSEESKIPPDGLPVTTTSQCISQHLRFLTTFGMTKWEGAPQNDWGGGAPQNDERGGARNDGGGDVIPSTPRCHSERPPLSFRAPHVTSTVLHVSQHLRFFSVRASE